MCILTSTWKQGDSASQSQDAGAKDQGGGNKAKSLDIASLEKRKSHSLLKDQLISTSKHIRT